ncbi:hypothetical protein PSPO01_15748 [Paraphaeosphaeria sporulosa]
MAVLRVDPKGLVEYNNFTVEAIAYEQGEYTVGYRKLDALGMRYAPTLVWDTGRLGKHGSVTAFESLPLADRAALDTVPASQGLRDPNNMNDPAVANRVVASISSAVRSGAWVEKGGRRKGSAQPDEYGRDLRRNDMARREVSATLLLLAGVRHEKQGGDEQRAGDEDPLFALMVLNIPDEIAEQEAVAI